MGGTTCGVNTREYGIVQCHSLYVHPECFDLLFLTVLHLPTRLYLSCSDLFEDDLQGHTHNPQQSPKSEGDDWPTINVYASCKTCDAYVLDYFAEEAFERRQNYEKQALFYLTGAAAGFGLALLCYLQHLARPSKDNEVELLSSYGGVVA